MGQGDPDIVRGSPDSRERTLRGTTEATRAEVPRARAKRHPVRYALYAALAAVVLTPFVWIVATRPKDPPPPPPPAAPPPPPPATPITELAAPVTSSRAAANAYRLATQAFRAGAVHEAIRQYVAAVDADPGFAAAHLRLAFLDAGEPEGYAHHYRAALQQRATLSPRDQAVLDAVEPWLRDVPDGAEVVKRLEAAMKEWRFDAELLWLLGTAYNDDGRPDDALPIWARAASVDPEFATPLWSRARVLLERGSEDEAKEALKKCLEVSPGAASCLYVRALMELHDGACAEMEADARAVAAASPSEERPYADLARALSAQGAAEEAVDQALAQKWAATPEASRAWQRLFDEADVAAWSGNLEGARAKLAEAERVVAASPIESVHAEHARRAILLYEETGQLAAAAEVARSFLARRRAWTGHVGTIENAVELDPVPLAFSVLVRTGAATRAERDRQVGAWHDAWRARLSAGSRKQIWFSEYGTPGETEEDARLGLGALVDSWPLPEWYAFTSADAQVGKLRFLVGDLDAAVPLLRRGAAACNVLDHPIEHARTEAMLGEALEKQGDTAGACAAYAALAHRWSAAHASVTLRTTRARLAALHCE